MNYPAYPTYKDVGVKWIDVIPEHWTLSAVKRCYDAQLGKMLQNTPESEQDVKVLYLKAVNVLWERVVVNELQEMWASPKEVEHYSVQYGDMLVCEGGEAGRAAILDGSPPVCIIQNALHRVRSKDSNDLKFLLYLLRHTASCGWLDVLCNKATIAHFTGDKLANLELPLPPLEEQTAIAVFLNSETDKIDALIAKQERLIAVLQEKRQALISNVVTKGLNPDAPMKDSGVEWLGEVPAHWEVKRNKSIFRQADDRSTTGEEELLSVSHITGVTPRSEKTVNMFMAETLEDYKRCQPGDLVINTMWAYMGALGTAKILGVVSPSYNVYRTRNPECINPQYIDYLYRTPRHITEIGRNSRGVWESRLRLYPNEFFDMRTPLPPRSEQDQIVEYIGKKNNQYAAAEKRCLDCVELLQERRAALISAAVTGKIDVRNQMN